MDNKNEMNIEQFLPEGELCVCNSLRTSDAYCTKYDNYVLDKWGRAYYEEYCLTKGYC